MINSLFEKIKNGQVDLESQLFTALSERFRYFLQYKVTTEEDRMDVIQESLKAIASKYLTVKLEVKFSSWAYGVLEKSLLHYYRSRANQQKKQASIEDSYSSGRSMSVDLDLKLRLERCFEKLCHSNRRYARILNLHYNGYEIEEIIRKMALTKNNAYIILSRGRGLLKNCLKTGELK